MVVVVLGLLFRLSNLRGLTSRSRQNRHSNVTYDYCTPRALARGSCTRTHSLLVLLVLMLMLLLLLCLALAQAALS